MPVGDTGSGELLVTILGGEEERADWLETRLEVVRQIGGARYLAQRIRD